MHNMIYFHVCTTGRWKQIVTQLFKLIKSSGLLDIVQQVFVAVLGSEIEAVKQILNHPKIVICFHSMNKALYERGCLLKLWEYAERETFNVLYIHSKGINPGRQTPQVDDWINHMCYFLITQHQRCIELLEDYHTVGVDIQQNATSFHYAGNFWWARSDHIKKLPKQIGPNYTDPEFWIGSTTESQMVSRWQSGIDHYRFRYPPSNYTNKEKLVIKRI